jgi:hypothetical protein
MEPSTVISVAAVCVAFIFGAAAHFRTKSFTELSERVAKIEARVETYFDNQEKYNALILHRDDDPYRIDLVLEKREHLQPIEPDEASLLMRELESIVYDKKKSIGERHAASQLLSIRLARDVECE